MFDLRLYKYDVVTSEMITPPEILCLSPCFVSMRTKSRCFLFYYNTPRPARYLIKNVMVEYLVVIRGVCLCCYPFMPLRNILMWFTELCSPLWLQQTVERLHWPESNGNISSRDKMMCG